MLLRSLFFKLFGNAHCSSDTYLSWRAIPNGKCMTLCKCQSSGHKWVMKYNKLEICVFSWFVFVWWTVAPSSGIFWIYDTFKGTWYCNLIMDTTCALYAHYIDFDTAWTLLVIPLLDGHKDDLWILELLSVSKNRKNIDMEGDTTNDNETYTILCLQVPSVNKSDMWHVVIRNWCGISSTSRDIGWTYTGKENPCWQGKAAVSLKIV